MTGSKTIGDTLKSLISYRFHKDSIIFSPSKIANGLKAGHDLLSLLRNCSAKSSSALDQLSRTLEQVSIQAEDTYKYRHELASRWKPPPPGRVRHLENLRRNASKANQVSKSSSPRIFQHPRPLSEVRSGLRKVPNLMSAHGIPMLKYPGPTCVLVNRVIKEKILWGIRKWDQHQDMEERIAIGELEDAWDKTLAEFAGISEDDGDAGQGNDESQSLVYTTNAGKVVKIYYYDPTVQVVQDNGDEKAPGNGSTKQAQRRPQISWTAQTRHVDHVLADAVKERGRQYTLLGERYWNEVVLKEREMREAERREKKHQRRMARKTALGVFFSEDGAKEGSDSSETSSVTSGYI